jgi:hypothetical protein
MKQVSGNADASHPEFLGLDRPTAAIEDMMRSERSVRKNRAVQPRAEPKNLRAVRVEADSHDDVSAAVARTVTRPSVTAAETIDAFKGLGERGCDINELVAELDAQVDRVRAGKMARCEALLVAQAHITTWPDAR